jgi:hypothetical protein
MCFCASGSFALGTTLLPVGVYCVTEAARKDRDYLALAASPLGFSVQQFCEGFVWLGLGAAPPRPGHAAVLAFLFFALVFWPFWSPFSVVWFRWRHRRLLALLMAFAASVGLSVYLPILTHPQRYLIVTTRHHSIDYDFTSVPLMRVVPEFVLWVVYVLVAVVVPLLLCSDRRLRRFWAAMLVAAVVSQVAFWYALVSVWCFFAAALSLDLAFYLHRLPTRSVRSFGLQTGRA